MKKVLLSAVISASTWALPRYRLWQRMSIRGMSWWSGNGRHQVTPGALEEFHKQNPDINVKAEYTGWDGHLSRASTPKSPGETELDVM